MLWESGLVPQGKKITFFTRSGDLYAVLNEGWIELNFPTRPVEEAKDVDRALLQKALGAEALSVYENNAYLVELQDEETLRGLQPDFALIEALPVRTVIVTCRSDEGSQYDFISRYFAPKVGVNEDPVTGSAHCKLAPYWSAKLGKTEMKAYQASARGGEIRVRYAGERTHIAGQACTVFKGSLFA